MELKRVKQSETSFPPMSQRWKEPYKDGPAIAILTVKGNKEEWEETGLACPFCQEVGFVYSQVFQNNDNYLGRHLICISCESKFQLPGMHFHTMLDADYKSRIQQLDKFSIKRDEE